METVNSLASAASRAIWGDSTQTTTHETAGTEPVSGKTGNVEAGEPYDKGNEAENTTSTSSTVLPTHLNYQKGETGTSTGTTTDSTVKDTPSTTTDTTSTPSTNTNNTSTTSDNTTSDSTPSQEPPTTSNLPTSTTSRMAESIPSTTINPSTTGSDTAAPSNRSDPHPAVASVGNQEAIEKNVPEKSDNEDDEASQQAALKADGITETKGEGDHAPKFDTFKTAGGPHIGDGKNDGRVGPSFEKGDLKEFENHDGGEGLKRDEGAKDVDHLAGETGSHHGSGSEFKKETSAADSGHSVDSGDKEKVSLKDKIKAKLHKH